MKSAMNSETLRILDKPVEDNAPIKSTLDNQGLDLKEELKKVLGLKSVTNLGSIRDSIVNKQSIKTSRTEQTKSKRSSAHPKSAIPSQAKLRSTLNIINAYNRSTFNNLKFHQRKQNFYPLGKVPSLVAEPESDRPLALHQLNQTGDSAKINSYTARSN